MPETNTEHLAGTMSVAIYAESEELQVRAKAEQLAAELGLPISQNINDAYEYFLTLTPKRLELRRTERGVPGPIYVDFVGGPLGYSRRVGGTRLLYQAVGIRPGKPLPRVLDATAGLGQDAFLLAYRGCSVTAIERSPILAALLRDGIERVMRVPEISQRIDDRLKLMLADARDVLKHLPIEGAPDVIYLDPMFPPKKKSALVKKEMRILRQLVGDDTDAGELFELARQIARQQVVVKRMRLAPPLAPNPTRAYSGRTTRYDVYE